MDIIKACKHHNICVLCIAIKTLIDPSFYIQKLNKWLKDFPYMLSPFCWGFLVAKEICILDIRIILHFLSAIHFCMFYTWRLFRIQSKSNDRVPNYCKLYNSSNWIDLRILLLLLHLITAFSFDHPNSMTFILLFYWSPLNFQVKIHMASQNLPSYLIPLIWQ
jgi:hypothetical protein